MKHSILRELEWYSKQTINTTFQSIAKVLRTIELNEKLPNINEIAKKAYTTPSSIMRFCSQIGYDGYKEFINRLNIELEYSGELDANSSEKFNWSSDFIFDSNYEHIIRNMRKMNEDSYLSILDLAQNIVISKNIYLCFNKENKHIVDYFYDNLFRLGLKVFLIADKPPTDLVNNQQESDLFLFLLLNQDHSDFDELIQVADNKYFITSNTSFLGFEKEITFQSTDSFYGKLNNFNIYIFYLINQILRLIEHKIK